MRSIAARISSGSASRPLPTYPQASCPSPGSINLTPRATQSMHIVLNSRMGIHMHIHSGRYHDRSNVASKVVLSISSPRPSAILPIIFAVAGATSTRSALSAKSICETTEAIFLIKGIHKNMMTRKRLKRKRRNKLNSGFVS